MRLPIIRGTIDRRILVNFQVAPDVLTRLLPAPFRPRLIGEVGLAGLCLIRLKQVRPRGFPRWLGIGSENAALRIAVTWDEAGTPRQGVFIPRRDTSLWLNSLVGGRIFPGVHHLARFQVGEHGDFYRIHYRSVDGSTHATLAGQVGRELPTKSVFASLQEAAAYFQAGGVGYSPAPRPGRFDGLELCITNWNLEPLQVTEVTSSYWDDPRLFPAGSVRFDSALLMRQVEHEWRSQPTMVTEPRWSANKRCVPFPA
jgi:hypothetical protein